MNYDYDLFVVGAGSGGVRAARMSAQYGARVAIAEDLYLGGTCVNVGCVPKKLFVYASDFSEAFHEATGFGWRIPGQPTFDWQTLVRNKNNEINRLNGIYNNLLNNAGVQIIHGRATLHGSNTVLVNGKTYTAERILIATGSWPFVPEFPGSEHVISSNEAFYLDQLPDSIVIVGGGYIAVEFACIFHGLGVSVHQIYRKELFLRGFDEDLRLHLRDEMQQKGIQLHFQTDVESIKKLSDGKLQVKFTNGEILNTDCVMYATGRLPKTYGLGLENTGVKLDDVGAIKVDDQFRTNDPSIYALGDVIDRVALTPVAIAEAMCLSANLYGNNGKIRTMDYENIASAVFSQPNIGTVGLTETQAREKYGEVTIYRSHFRALKNTLSGSADKTFMKLVVDTKTDKVVGCHMLGHDAGEIIQGIAIAIKAGATKADFDSTVGIHPTAAEEFVTMRTPD